MVNLLCLFFCTFSNYRSTRTSLFDGIEEGGIRATSYSSHEIDEQENDRAVDGLQDRVSILKRVLGRLISEFLNVLLCSLMLLCLQFISNDGVTCSIRVYK
jgi:hypothetical protein